MTIDEAMRVALEHHRAGRLAEAEGIYRNVLRQLPEPCGGALNLLGVMAGQGGDVNGVDWPDLEVRSSLIQKRRNITVIWG